MNRRSLLRSGVAVSALGVAGSRAPGRGGSPGTALRRIATMPAAHKALLYHGNAERVFGIDANV